MRKDQAKCNFFGRLESAHCIRIGQSDNVRKRVRVGAGSLRYPGFRGIGALPDMRRRPSYGAGAGWVVSVGFVAGLPGVAGATSDVLGLAGRKLSDAEFIQYRSPVGAGPSLKTCPK